MTHEQLRDALAGVVAITVTPFDTDGDIDEKAYATLVERLLAGGVGVVTPNGNTSEFYALDRAETERAVDVTARTVGSRATVLCGVGHDVATATAAARYAQRAGAAGIMIHQPVHPYVSLGGWVDYHRAIAEAVPDLGVVLYVRNPRIGGAQIAALGEACPNVVGVKYAVPDPVRFACVARDAGLDALFARAIAASPSVANRMANAQPIGSLVACADYSYDSRYYVGEGHILVGDAAAFIDPLFSSGVMMAMSTAAFGATVVEALLDGLDSRERHMRDYERKIRLSLHSLSWLIYRINSPILRDLLMSSFDLFNTRQRLITILAGDFYESRSFLSPLRRVQLAYGCLFLLSKIGFRLRAGGIERRPLQHGTSS